MVEQEQFDHFANWLIQARNQAKRAQASNDFLRLTTHYSIDDYGIRKKGDHVESYNLYTGETLFEAQHESEAMQDLREEFRKRT